MEASIYLKDNHISGEIKVIKDKNHEIHVAESSISKLISGRHNNIILDSKEIIIENINSVLFSMCFSSRYIRTDMYDNKKYDTDDDFKTEYLWGIQNMYNIPAGAVFYHNSNKLLFDCTNIEFMMTYDIISFKYTNIDKTKIYKVKRSNGDIQPCILINNGGLFIKDDELRIINTFNKDKNIELESPYLGEYQKGITINDFIELNNINIEITIPFFSDIIIESVEPLMKEVLMYYNDKLNNYKEKLIKYENIILIN